MGKGQLSKILSGRKRWLNMTEEDKERQRLYAKDYYHRVTKKKREEKKKSTGAA